jgi:hypothetical protein
MAHSRALTAKKKWVVSISEPSTGGGMETLETVLATGVLEVLRAKAHVVIAPARNDALRDEVAAIIAPALPRIRAQLGISSRVGQGTRAHASQRGDTPHPGVRGVSAEESDPSSGAMLGNDAADEAVAAIVEQITERLMESDHVDDIFADDGAIRRDAFRAIRDILLGTIHGEIAVEPAADEGAFEVRLDALGYVVSAVSRQLDHDMLTDALDRAAAALRGRLLALSPERVASVELPGGAEAGRLALEEAISEELSLLVETELVELPSVEQVFQLTEHVCMSQEFETAVSRAVARTKNLADCNAHCTVLDDSTLIARLTPLSKHAAANADEAFSQFLGALEDELAALTLGGGHGSPSSKRPASGGRRRKSVADAPRQAPRSEPRGSKSAPDAAASSTRERAERKAAK